VINKVKKGDYIMDPRKKISREAMDLVKKMLSYDPQKRISSTEVMMHPWIKDKGQIVCPSELIAKALEQLLKFRVTNILQIATLTYIVSQQIGNKEIDHLKKVFFALDKFSNGGISKDEILLAFKRYCNRNVTSKQLDEILAQVDSDLSGQVGFTEFLCATINPEEVINEDTLEAAFKKFDADGGGTISLEEVRDVVCAGKSISNRVWEDVIKDIEMNEDGEIDFDLFTAMMRKLLGVTNFKKGTKKD
jgi:calcium-dependent protein kinase